MNWIIKYDNETITQGREHFCNKSFQCSGFILMIFTCVDIFYHFNYLTYTTGLKTCLYENLLYYPAILCVPLATSVLTPSVYHLHPISTTVNIFYLWMLVPVISFMFLQSPIHIPRHSMYSKFRLVRIWKHRTLRNWRNLRTCLKHSMNRGPPLNP